MRGVIDIGTNSVLLLVAARDQAGDLTIVRDEARVTRLGQGVAESRRLRSEAIARTCEVLREYRAIAERDGAEIVAVATEGLRMADNRDSFVVEAERVLGCPLRTLSGDEEAELSYLSVAREMEPDVPLRVLDIGGGSTELVVGRGTHIEQRRSHSIGSVRLTERFVDRDPPSPESLAAIEAAARQAFAEQPVAPAPELHGLAGTVTTAAALLLDLRVYDREKVDGSRFEIARVRQLRDSLASETLAERSTRPLLPIGRADVIVAGLTILLAALAHCGADTLVVRDRGLRYALL